MRRRRDDRESAREFGSLRKPVRPDWRKGHPARKPVNQEHDLVNPKEGPPAARAPKRRPGRPVQRGDRRLELFDEVLELKAKGLSLRRIADQLSISKSLVHEFIRHADWRCPLARGRPGVPPTPRRKQE